MRICVAVGHGMRPNGVYDPGAKAAGKSEQTEGDPIAREMTRVLREAGHEVLLIPRGGPNWSGAAKRANWWGAQFAIEIHHDWSGAPRGAFGHWLSAEGKRYADAMLRRVVTDLNWPTRPGWHKRRRLAWLTHTNMPSVLWECDRIGTITNHGAYGRALAHGVLDVIGPAATPQDHEEEDMPLSKEDIRQVAAAAAAETVRQLLGHGKDKGRDLWSLIRSGGLRYDELENPHEHDHAKKLDEIHKAVREEGQ